MPGAAAGNRRHDGWPGMVRGLSYAWAGRMPGETLDNLAQQVLGVLGGYFCRGARVTAGRVHLQGAEGAAASSDEDSQQNRQPPTLRHCVLRWWL